MAAIDSALDQGSWTCTVCSKPSKPGQPHKECWVTLKCSSCGATHLDARIPEYFDFDVIETTCPTCRK